MKVDLRCDEESMKAIRQMIEERIDAHIEENPGMYSGAQLEELRPVWRKHALERLEESGLMVFDTEEE